MFNRQIRELFKYITKNELTNELSVNYVKRNNIVKYEFKDNSFYLCPFDSVVTLDNYNELLIETDSTHIFFIDNLNFGTIQNSNKCRELTSDDCKQFKIFLDSCSAEDKDQGMVSLEDDFIYGLFEDDLLVAVSSLWNWGDILSDIGVLVHPNYRKKGYAKTVCQTLMSNIKRDFVWRCDSTNNASYNLAVSIGFIPTGFIKEQIVIKK
ncbi:GNAT family N-acetyltransferase [Candidatus Izimaplasma sp. ZiA1]|uniref:GNAT family N-acetyltransferase n=1 Tax=Candidatus Izimoplasma sp. ZiA1 TaxID=2024899 RepID=UPI00143B6164